MAGRKGYAWETSILDYVFGGSVPPALSTIYVALFANTPATQSDLIEVSDIGGGNYSRKSVTNNATNFPAATQFGSDPASKTNATTITFPTASSDWGLLLSFGIFDASTGGNLFYWGPISPGIYVASGDAYSIPANSLLITER